MPNENANAPRVDGWDALRALFRFAIFVFVVGCILIAGSVAGLIYVYGKEGSIAAAIPYLSGLLIGLSHFLSPLLQLFVVLVIVEWFLRRIGFTFRPGAPLKGLDWNTQTIIAVIVVGAFAVAALYGLTVGLSALKDVALVVVGFYFGTQRKTVELQTEQGTFREVVEHENPVPVKQPDKPAGGTPESPTDKTKHS